MANLHLTILLAALQLVAAQGSEQITWGAVAFTYHGEKTPALAYNGYHLSPLGANQLLGAGSVVRDRYVSPPLNETDLTEAAPINGLSVSSIQNTQLDIMSTDDEYVVASAMAFMQGLYPPLQEFILDAETLLSNSSYVQYPLDGYQYPNVETVNSLDFNYIW